MINNKISSKIFRVVLTLGILTALPVSLIAFRSLQQIDSSRANTVVSSSSVPIGSHFTINIMGVPREKTSDLTGDDDGRIFTRLEGKMFVNLFPGDFKIVDSDGTDGKASISLPFADPNKDGVSTYSVWVRTLVKPGGSTSTTFCANDATTNDLYCNVYQSVSLRVNGRSNFTDITNELLFLYVDLNGDGVNERYPLFDEALQGYFWDYDNNGLKLLQLRLYQTS